MEGLSAEVDFALCVHIETDPCSIGSFVNVNKGMLLLHTVAVKFNEATITNLPSILTIRIISHYWSSYFGLERKAGLGGFRWINAPMKSEVAIRRHKSKFLTEGFIDSFA